MPTRLATRSTSRAEDPGPSRTTRTTAKSAITKGKKPAGEIGDADEILAKEMERVLKVSDPEPQTKVTKSTRTAAVASKGKAKDTEAAVKKTVPAATSRTVKAPITSTSTSTTATAARRPTARAVPAREDVEPTQPSRRTATSSSTAPGATLTAKSSSTASKQRAPATSSRKPVAKAVDDPPQAVASSSTLAKPVPSSSASSNTRIVKTATVRPTTTGSSSAKSAVASVTTKPATIRSTASNPSTTQTASSSHRAASSTAPARPAQSVNSARTAASSGSAPGTSEPKTASSTATRQPGASTSRMTPAVSSTAPPAAQATGSARTRPQISLKGKEREMDMVEPSPTEYPWMDGDNGMSHNARAQDAMSAVRSCMSSFQGAYKLEYRYGETKGDWNTDRLDKEMGLCDAALRIMREMDARGVIGSGGIEVEKAGQAILAKTVALGMPRRAFNQLVLARSGILRRYKHSNDPIPVTSAPVASEGTQRIKAEWLECCWLPTPADPDEVTQVLRTIFVQQLTSAWSCLIGIEGYGYDLPPFHELMSLSCPDKWLSPLQMARLDSAPTYCVPMLALTRRLSVIPKASPHWSNVFTSLMNAYIVVTTEGDPTLLPGQAVRKPAQLWDFLNKWLVSYMNSPEVGERKFEIANRIVSDILDWCEQVIETRKETRQGWFSGKAFTDLMNFWIDLSRKCRTPTYVKRAVSLIAGTSSVRSLPLDDPLSTDVIMDGTPAPDDLKAGLIRLYGQLSLVETLLTDTESPDMPKAKQALIGVEWQLFGPCVGDLGSDAAGKADFAKAYRYWERPRRFVVKLCDSVDDSTTAECRRFLLSGAAAVEQVLTRTTLVDTPEYGYLSHSATSAIAKYLVKSSPSTDPSDILPVLDLGKRMSWLTKDSDTRALCLKILGEASAALSHAMHTKGSKESGAIIARQSIEINNLAFAAYREGGKPISPEWNVFLSNRCKIWDVLTQCLADMGDRQGAIEGAVQMAFNRSPTVYENLEKADESLTIESIFKDNCPQIVERLTYFLCADVEPVGGLVIAQRVASVFDGLKTGGSSPKVVSLLAEKIFESMLVRAMRPESMETAYAIGKRTLELLVDDHRAIRRLRIVSRLMLLTSSYGTKSEDFEELLSTARSLIDTLRSRLDTSPTLIAEYSAIVLMLQAFQVYQQKEDAARDVIQLAAEVIHELRQLLVPPTRTPTSGSPDAKKEAGSLTGTVRLPTKAGRVSGVSRSLSTSGHPATAAKMVITRRASSEVPITEFDDIAQLSSMLAALISLLGLLGDVMAQVDGIKVLRALLRHREDMLNDYVAYSGELASLYSKLGKHTRAANVFSQALRTASENPKFVSASTQVMLHLRHCEHLASSGEEALALKAFASAEELYLTLVEPTHTLARYRHLSKIEEYKRIAFAHRALASIRLSRDDAAGAIRHKKSAVLMQTRVMNGLVSLASERPKTKTEDPKNDNDNPFSVAAPPPEKTGKDELSKDAAIAGKSSIHPYTDKYTSVIHWKGSEDLVDAYLDLANAYAQRGSAQDARYYFEYAHATAKAVRSSAVTARTATKLANLRGRMGRLDEAQEKLGQASNALSVLDGPDAFDFQRVKGDILARQEMTEEANQVFEAASEGIHGLDTVFSAADALLPSPKKETLARTSLSLSTLRASKEPLLPSTLSQILRRQAWLFREAKLIKESDELYRQVQMLQSAGDSKAEESYLAGKLALDDAFNHFQSDLFMSSLTESTIAMPMGTPGKKVDHRQSTRHRIQVILEQADHAYQSALTLVAGSGKVEDVRQACLSLALLRAFQTSLGQGGSRVTSFAADLLASSTSIGLHREILEAIEGKFLEPDLKNMAWPTVDGSFLKSSQTTRQIDPEAEEDITTDPALQTYWEGVRTRHETRSFLSPDGPSYDLSVLPKTWAIVSISVTEDRNTMFISRHQNGHDPLVFCLPLDRQSKREGEEEDVFTFDAGITELKTIIRLSEECSAASKFVTTPEGRTEWWATRRTLDERMKQMIDNVEFCWLGAFKTIFSPRQSLTAQRLELFRGKIEKVFNLALFGSTHDSKKHGKVHLSSALLECFATLSSKSRDEEIEDFIYFILDIYQFHGVPVAVSELDLDQVGIDVVTALTEMEASAKPAAESPDGPEHLLLALDKNAQPFPWESIPCLRGRPVSRVPSLPVLLDQVALGKIMQPNSVRRMVNSKKTHYILNPSGDLVSTQSTFEPFVKDMQERAGWKGVIGEKPSELEMSQILKNNDLVLYFGHGGGEQYIRGSKVRTLPKCATVFLWGCSSGKLEDQGDLDLAGTAWNYMMAGCPALTATLWDVTDKDIDRYTTSVYKRLGLDPAHVIQQEKPRAEHSDPGLLPLSNQGLGLSTVEAINMSRDDCKLTYLTGAAVVHYGIPVYIY